MSTGKPVKAAIGAALETAKASGYKKYTIHPSGIWRRINRMFAIDPNRSTGVPLNNHFRLPQPGSNDPRDVTDPVTAPSGDIADNPYWKRDMRRSYPKLSVVKQPDVVGLLSVGSAASPNEEVLKIGDAGKTQLVEVKEEGEKGGLSVFFEKDANASKGVLGPGGLPPLPASLHRQKKQYELQDSSEQAYGPTAMGTAYPCRTFI